ncbi:iron chelate uptake ABC transporter family permease subunit, partial [Azospirillum sp. B506]|uniref:iron chelate uptake ABC transporter family permease subunit n=1 Tax=Azospirillum sp. B506 TaxID=137721 RepID=UPI0011DE0698
MSASQSITAMPPARRPRLAPVLGLLGAALAAAVLFALSTGSIPLPLDRVLSHLAQAAGMPGEPLGSRDAAVLYTLRLPRIVLAAAVGVTLGVAGASLQAIFRNPLADPGLVGVSSGAALAGSATMMLGVAGLGLSRSGLSLSTLLPVTAFLGALAATILILTLARRDGRCSATDMLLAGIAVNSWAAPASGL